MSIDSDPFRSANALALLAAIVESSDDAIVGKTLDGRIASWNRGAERIFGYTAEEVVGRHVSMLAPPGRQDEIPRILGIISNGGRVDHFITERVTKDGRVLVVSITVSPIRDASGTVVGASKISRDITAQRRAEEALREADRRKDEFLAILAHELRNPLAPIRNAAELMRDAAERVPEIARPREIIERQVEHLAKLVDDLLDVARISRGEIRLAKEPVEVARAASIAVDAVEPIAKRRNQHLDVTIGEGNVVVNADPNRLTQMISNLLSNASKFTPDGGHIALSVAREGDVVAIRVRDDGIGIPADLLPRVFEPFRQLEMRIEGRESGIGIGLSVVKQLAELHGGSVVARSEGRGRGAELTLHLPATTDAPKRLTPARSTKSGSARILIVDDNEDAALTLELLLERRGHPVHVAHNGVEALESAVANPPDVALLDIAMPGMDGYELAKRLRAQNPSCVLVALTGYGQADDRARATAAGFDHHLVKPVDFPTLYDLLATVEGAAV